MAAAKKLSLKLLIDTKAKRVLFAEAGKDVVDFLFSLLSLPVATVIRLLNKTNMVGCIGNLYRSVENLDDTYVLQPSKSKELILMPKLAAGSLVIPLLAPNESTLVNAGKVYGWASGNHHNRVSSDPSVSCTSCGSHYTMSSELTYVSSGSNTAATSGTGYVKEVVNYMVMDDLSVMPMSTISSITLLSKFNVADISLLEERVVDFGMDEGLEFLKTSLQSKNVLSQVFLGSKVK